MRGYHFENVSCVRGPCFSVICSSMVHSMNAHRGLSLHSTCMARSSLTTRERQTRKRLAPGRRRGWRWSRPANGCDCQEPNVHCSQHFDTLLPTAQLSKAARTHRKGLASTYPHHHTSLSLSESRYVSITRARALTYPHRHFDAVLLVQQWSVSRCSAPSHMERLALVAQH